MPNAVPLRFCLADTPSAVEPKSMPLMATCWMALASRCVPEAVPPDFARTVRWRAPDRNVQGQAGGSRHVRCAGAHKHVLGTGDKNRATTGLGPAGHHLHAREADGHGNRDGFRLEEPQAIKKRRPPPRIPGWRSGRRVPATVPPDSRCWLPLRNTASEEMPPNFTT